MASSHRDCSGPSGRATSRATSPTAMAMAEPNSVMGAACAGKARAAMAMKSAAGTPRIMIASTPRSDALTVVGSRVVAVQALASAPASTAQGKSRSGDATSAGYPLDLTFYQTVKGITAASHIVKPGGRILVVSACTEGAGAPEFCEMLERFPTPQAFLDHVAENPVVVDQWQLEKLALVCRDKELLFYVPGLEARFRDKLWGRTFDSVNEAVAATLAGLDAGARIAVIPEGPYVLARVEEGVLA